MSNAIVSVNDIQTMAVAVAKSGMFGVRTPEQAMSLMLIAQAEGLHPAIAARDYHVINGKPALKSDAMLARFQTAGGRVEWLDFTDDKVSARFSHPQGGSVVVDWTIERAKRAGVANNPTWAKFPRAMLKARVISEGVRTVYPGVTVGTYTVEEVRDMAGTPVAYTEMETAVDPVDAIMAAADLDALKNAYIAAIKAAKKAKDGELERRLNEAKDRRKSELEAITVEVE
jgi:hypothetical protein